MLLAVRATVAAESARVGGSSGVLLTGGTLSATVYLSGPKSAHRHAVDVVAELHGAVDEERVGDVVLNLRRGGTHPSLDKVDGLGEFLREEVGQAVVLRPVLPDEALRREGRRPVHCESVGKSVLDLVVLSRCLNVPVVPPPKVLPAITFTAPSSVANKPEDS